MPSWRHHRLRTALTLIGVIIGVQIVVAVSLVNRSTIASFESTAETIAGSADLQISNGMAGVPERLIEQAARWPGVESAAGLVQGTLRTEWGPLTLFGADLLGDQRIRQTQFPKRHVRIADELRFLNAPDSIALSTSFAERAGLSLGSSFQALAPEGNVTLTVRGFLDPVGPTALFGGAVALADLPTAQRLCMLGDRVDQIDLQLVDGVAAARIAAELAPLLDGIGTVGPPRDRALRLGNMLASVQMILTLFGLFAMVVGGFIIYHTMQTAIVQRRRDLALSRAIGFSATTVAGAMTLEAVALGAVGAAVGVVLGALGARLSLGVVTSGIGAIWARIDDPRLVVTVWDAAIGGLLGVGISLAATVIPSRQLLRLRVLEHLRAEGRDGGDGTGIAAIACGAALLAVGTALPYLDVRPEGFNARVAYIMTSVVLLAFGYVFLIPTFARQILRTLGRLARRTRGLSFRLATEQLGRSMRRGPGATPALMCAFAMVLIIGAFITSLEGTLTTWLEQTFAADLGVMPSSQVPLPTSPTLPPGLEPTVTAIPGVAVVSPSRVINTRLDDELAILRTETPASMRRRAYPLVESGGADWLTRFDRGEAVVISENLAYRRGWRPGDVVTFDTPSGRLRFPIAAVVVDYTLDVGTVLIDSATYRRLWQDDLANYLAVWLEPEADADEVRARITASVPPSIPLTIITAAEAKRTLTDAIDDALVMTYAIQLLAIVIALIGLVNFFLAEIEDRRREIGLLRGVALKRRELLRVFLLEALIIGSLGGFLAALYAWPVAIMLVTRSARLVSGLRLEFTFPYGLAAVTVALAGTTSMLAAYYPFRRAVAVPVAELIGME